MMQTAIQAAVGRTNMTAFLRQSLTAEPEPAYRVAERLGLNKSHVTVALSDMYRRGAISRVIYKDPKDWSVRYAYMAGASDGVHVPKTSKAASNSMVRVIPAQIEVTLGSKRLTLTLKEGRQLLAALNRVLGENNDV
jgi:hypothetical protein